MLRLPNLLLALALLTAVSCVAQSPPTRPFIITGYVFPRGAALTPGQVDASKLTRINYAFANIQSGRMVPGYPTDAQNFALLRSLRNTNPNLTLLVSVGGWLWSTNFSDVALTRESRAVFEDSVMQFLTRYDLDGLDIDWEYPGMPGSGHPFRSEDKQNFTSLLRELRERFDASARRGRRLYLTIAMGASDEVIANTEMQKVQRYVDTVNLMTYDYYEPGSESITGNHAPLFPDPADPKAASSAETVRAFEKAGVPAEKILLGVPFYGHEWGQVKDQNHGLFQVGKPVPGADASFNAIESTMFGHGFARYWDEAAKVPYLYNPQQKIFVSYEDSESLKLKCQYIRAQKLAGIMFWEYFGDSNGTLLQTINTELRKP
ncbi:glycoside hydrolase family 18 protein [Occallatibacter savannae]|uniref:glycoside hydrolase family 18 protein n=1 Tax=Occallatibacter savannae TaxID=1002691 RepID=UPI000D69C959|nr:glycoside hydrolase family 18 protein [Occallatibacter savannae]